MTWASFLGSLAGVLAVVALAKWLGLGRLEPLDEAGALRIAEDTFVGHRFRAAAVDREGRAALVEGMAGEMALLRSHGDKWVARLLDLPTSAQTEGERLIIGPSEAMFGTTTLALDGEEAARWASRLRGASHA